MFTRLKTAVVITAVAATAALAAFADTRGETVPPMVEAGAQAPELAGIERWHNSAPLKLSELRGKVVLVDFWTYSCINCIHTIPYVNEWYRKYRDQGLVVIGVHTPEYPFERDARNVADALGRFGIRYPVAQDNRYDTWNAYGNRYWPALYLVDANGRIVYTRFGEGQYEKTEAAIRDALARAVAKTARVAATQGASRTQ